MRTLRDFNCNVDLDTTETLVEKALERGLECCQAEGALNDYYIIYNDRTLTFKGVKARKYILLYPKFLNEWSNSLCATFTDNFEKVSDFYESFGFEEEGGSLIEI